MHCERDVNLSSAAYIMAGPLVESIFQIKSNFGAFFHNGSFAVKWKFGEAVRVFEQLGCGSLVWIE